MFVDSSTQDPVHTTHHPLPQVPGGPGGGPGGRSYEHYDPKYNIYEEPNLMEEDTEPPSGTKVNYAQSTSSTVLVIGIVIVVIIAIVLIILIVFKMRTKAVVDYKVDESKRLETEERPSTSHSFPQQPKPVLKGVNSNNSNSNSNNNNNSGSSKPVKEWYV